MHSQVNLTWNFVPSVIGVFLKNERSTLFTFSARTSENLSGKVRMFRPVGWICVVDVDLAHIEALVKCWYLNHLFIECPLIFRQRDLAAKVNCVGGEVQRWSDLPGVNATHLPAAEKSGGHGIVGVADRFALAKRKFIDPAQRDTVWRVKSRDHLGRRKIARDSARSDLFDKLGPGVGQVHRVTFRKPFLNVQLARVIPRIPSLVKCSRYRSAGMDEAVSRG